MKHILPVCLAALMMVGCVEQWDFPSPGQPGVDEQGIAFSTTVSQITQATRADNTIVNKGERMLLPTETTGKKVGLFGCYTGAHTWKELIKLSEANPGLLKKETLTDEDKANVDTLKTYYSANQMYNVPADIAADGSLTYSPLHFWPNNTIPGGEQHEYMTFWAYYPYNATASLGEYGIAITTEDAGAGMGMGRVKFTMHSDAAQQNDFLISAPVTDCNRDKYPLRRTDIGNANSYAPQPVQFRLYHMLAQVRFYAFIRGDDKMVYQKDGDGNDIKADADWLATQTEGNTIIDEYGNVYTIKSLTKDGGGKVTAATIEQTSTGKADLSLTEFEALKLKVPDEDNCVRWDRNTLNIWDVTHSRRRADITYQMQLNNVKTTATFFPHYNTETGATTIDVEEPGILGSATVNRYIMNPYWFTFQDGQRTRLNDNYMFGYFEDTPVGRHFNALTAEDLKDATDDASLDAYPDVDGMDWSAYTYNLEESKDPLYYFADHDQKEKIKGIGDNASKHYNYFPGNILMVVPQTLEDADVPHVVITATGKQAKWDSENKKWTTSDTNLSAKVTVNLLKMGISWESGYIYCYAFLDDLKPGDDKVRGPESISVLFNKEWRTDQW